MNVNICRLCAESNCILHPIFNENVREKIEIFAPIKIAENDDLPKMICGSCSCKINAAYEFRLAIIETDEKLRLQISTRQIKDEPDESENKLMYDMCDFKTDENDESLSDNYDLSKNESDETEDEYDDVNENQVTSSCLDSNESKKRRDQRSDPAFATVCHKCGKLLKRNSFSDHMLNVHGQEARHECDICGKMVKTKRQLWHHKKNHNKETVSCDKCGKEFTSKAGFKRHYNNIHLGIRNYGCMLCEKTFPHVMALKRHMRSHTGERPYVCQYCKRSFGGRWNLKQHVRLHTKEKPYKCPSCPEAFTQNVMLKSHMRNKHPQMVSSEEQNNVLRIAQ